MRQLVLALTIAAGPAVAGDLTPWQAQTLALIAADEPSVVEAAWPNGATSSLWVSVRDDGSRRDGFAEYLCMTIGDAGAPAGSTVIVHVWDAYSMAREELKEIGQATCQR